MNKVTRPQSFNVFFLDIGCSLYVAVDIIAQGVTEKAASINYICTCKTLERSLVHFDPRINNNNNHIITH